MNNIKIFITGSAGLIGSNLYLFLKERGYIVYGVDIVSGETVDSILDVSLKHNLSQKLNEFSPEFIIHAAAIKSLDNCENDKSGSWNTNVESTAEIVHYCSTNKSKIIYISSDVVFDGKKGNYYEVDLPNPINWYGTTKYHSELLVRMLPNFVICRTALVLADLRNEDADKLSNEIKLDVLNNQSLLPFYIVRRLNEGRLVRLPSVIISSITHIDLLKKSIVEIISNDISGIYHCVGSEPISRYNFGLQLANFLGLDSNLIILDESNISPIRPRDLSLNINHTYGVIGLSKKDWNIENTINKLFPKI